MAEQNIQNVCELLGLDKADWWMFYPDFEKMKLMGYRRTLYGHPPSEEVGNIYELETSKEGYVLSFKLSPVDIPIEFVRAFE